MGRETRRRIGKNRAWRSGARGSLLISTTLAFTDQLQGLLARLGVDYPAFRSLLEAKLLMDVRRNPMAERGEGFASAGLLLLLALFWFAGLFIGAIAFFELEPFYYMAALQAAIGLMLTFSLVTDYINVLVDPADLEALAPHPVDDRTVWFARLAHLCVYFGLLALAISFFPVILGLVKYPWPFAPLMVLCTLGNAITTLFLAGTLCALGLRLFGDRFQRLLLYTQTFVLAMCWGGYRVLGNFVDLEPVLGAIEERSPWLYFFPPFHSGGLLAVVLGDHQGGTLVHASLALLFPVALVIGVSRLSTPGTLQGLFLRAPDRPSARPPRPLARRLARLITRTPLERAGFEFTVAVSRRDMLYIRTVFPMAVGWTAMAAAFSISAPSQGWLSMAGLMPLYVLGLLGPLALFQVRFSGDWKARWVLEVHPTSGLAEFVRGGVLAVGTTILLPCLGVLGALVLAFSENLGLSDVLLCTLWSTCLFLGFARFLGRGVPFAHDPKDQRTATTHIGTMLAAGFLAMAGSAVHFLARTHPAITVAALAVGVLLSRHYYKRLGVLEPELWNKAGPAPPVRRALSASRATAQD